jgi:hypothetical protein
LWLKVATKDGLNITDEHDDRVHDDEGQTAMTQVRGNPPSPASRQTES